MIFNFLRRSKKKPGQSAEQQAAQYLKQQGYQIVDHNIRTYFGEIDLIVENKCELLFIEVKSGKLDPDFSPEIHFSRQKQKHFLTSAKSYLLKHPSTKDLRLDLITITYAGKHTKLTHYRNVVEDSNSL